MEENLVSVTESAAEPTSESEEQNICKAKKAYSRCERNIGLYVGISLVVVIAVTLLYLFITDKEKLPLQISYLISFGSMYCVGFPIYLLLSRNAEKSAPKKNPFSFGSFLLYLMMGEALMLFGNIIGTIVTAIGGKLLGIELADNTLQTAVFEEKSILFIVIATTVGPAIEELLFRKVFIDRVRKYGDGKAILVTGILFGLFHGNFTQFFYAAFLGILLGYVYVSTGNIRNTIALHMTLNACGSLVPMLLMRNLDFEALSQEMSLDETVAYFTEHASDLLPLAFWGISLIVVAITGVILLIVRLAGGKFKLNPPEAPIPKEKNFSVTCLNVGMLIFLAVTVFQFCM